MLKSDTTKISPPQWILIGGSVIVIGAGMILMGIPFVIFIVKLVVNFWTKGVVP